MFSLIPNKSPWYQINKLAIFLTVENNYSFVLKRVTWYKQRRLFPTRWRTSDTAASDHIPLPPDRKVLHRLIRHHPESLPVLRPSTRNGFGVDRGATRPGTRGTRASIRLDNRSAPESWSCWIWSWRDTRRTERCCQTAHGRRCSRKRTELRPDRTRTRRRGVSM